VLRPDFANHATVCTPNGVYIIVKRTLKRALVAAAIPSALVVALMIWKANFFLLPFATIEENGHVERGYVYANSYHPKRVTHLVITRSESGHRHSYLAWVEDDPHHGAPAISDCEDWTIAYLPLFMFPHVNPPCIKWYAAEEAPLPPKTPKRDVKVEERSVEFTANDGKRVTVRW
jgi:hypothetical protein